MLKLFAAGLETETNTFSPMPTGLDDFTVIGSDWNQGETAKAIAPFSLWRQLAQQQGHKFSFGLSAAAEPSGLTTTAVYEQLRDELLAALRAAGPVDVVLLMLHGAMMAQGYDDCEGDLLQRVRQQVGPDVVIAVELDLHCHLTQAMLANSTIIITFKEYPHTDVNARGEELFHLALATAQGKHTPVMALFDCRMVGMYPTTTAIMRSFIDAMVETEQRDDVLSVSFGHGFSFGDMPEAGGKMLVVTDNNLPLAEQLAEQLGLQVFGLRHKIGFNSLPLEKALSQAVEKAASRSDTTKPIVVADQSDNAGGGAPSDATFALRWLLDNKITNTACAIFYDPQVVKLAITAGVGAELQVRLGGKLGVASGDPLDLKVKVVAINADYPHQFPQAQGKPTLFPAGDTVALHCQGIDIVVSSLRCQCFCPSIFDDFGIPARQRQLLIVKSAQHFYGAFAPIASHIIYMAGPGAVPPIMQQIPYQRMSTEDKFPWVENPFQITATAQGEPL